MSANTISSTQSALIICQPKLQDRKETLNRRMTLAFLAAVINSALLGIASVGTAKLCAAFVIPTIGAPFSIAFAVGGVLFIFWKMLKTTDALGKETNRCTANLKILEEAFTAEDPSKLPWIEDHDIITALRRDLTFSTTCREDLDYLLKSKPSLESLESFFARLSQQAHSPFTRKLVEQMHQEALKKISSPS